ncbi:MAG: sulfotransferase [Sulfuricaulis sp.]|uniref:tetratricopeptide repeat-containing sulfotransferase family protein n=1 Tax=Sulfuricaulis sp. TaxID=2003553 RepID=UPI003C3662E2
MSNLSKLLAKGGELVQQGDLAGAKDVFEKAARDHVHHAGPWISLSAVHGMSGNYNEALGCARKAVELAPNSLQGWVNLGNAAQSNGDLNQAAEAFRRACALPGCPSEIVLLLGLALTRARKWLEAEKSLREFLSRHPNHREATFALARVLAMKGESASAVAMAEQYCRQHSGDVLALLQLGAVYIELGRTQDAWRVCDQAMKVSSGSVDALSFRASLLNYEGRYLEARDTYEQLEKLKPGDLQVLITLARTCHQLGDTNAGIAYARAALGKNPRDAETLALLGNIFMLSDPAEARRLMEKAVATAPNNPIALALKADILEVEGDKQGAWTNARKAIEINPASVEAAIAAANVAPAADKIDEAIELLESLVARPGVSSSNQRSLRFALAKLCDKVGQFDRAFNHAVIANRLKNITYNISATLTEINRIKSVYSAAAVPTLPRSRISSGLPVFIVGMPRSGTSLLEQILSCHSKVHARGETKDVGKLLAEIPYYPDGVRNLTQEKLDALAGTYIQRLREIAPSATRVTDKMPGNYKYLGIISQLFPDTRVLHCKRDPRDVCLSNFFLDFSDGMDFAYDLESLAQTCKASRDLMDHWKAVLPIPILDVQYEELVEDPRTWVERILDFCGLEWEDACLNFHESKRQVMTASYDQVRRPLYKSSKARWKNYARHLEPVSRILGLNDG